VSGTTEAEKSATVTFEKETAAKTALLLDNTQLGQSQVHVSTASTISEIAHQAGGSVGNAAYTMDDLEQEDKPRSRIVAEYLAHGYTLSDNVIQQAIALDSKHGVSNRFTSALQNFDSKYKVTDKAQEMDNKYKVTDTAWNALGGLQSYFEKALGTPTGQKVRDFYVQGDKQVRDVHNEARRLADLKSGKSSKEEPHQVSGHPEKTVCSCGGSEGVCGCAPGKCSCANCSKSDNPHKSVNPPQSVTGTQKTVCTCGGQDGVCGCEPGKCACASCGKSSSEAVTEVKEAAQASGQHLPRETFGVHA